MLNDRTEDRPLFTANGYKVYFTHLQVELPRQIVGTDVPHMYRVIGPAAKGSTTCHVLNDNVGYTEVARCSMKDNFSRAEGRKQALRKVLIVNFTRPQRAVFWYEYFRLQGMIDRTFQIAQKWPNVLPPVPDIFQF